MHRRLSPLEERHAPAAARHQHGRRARAPQHLASGPLERIGIVVDVHAEDLLDLRLVRRAGGHALILEQPVAGVDEDRHCAIERIRAPPPRESVRRAPA